MDPHVYAPGAGLGLLGGEVPVPLSGYEEAPAHSYELDRGRHLDMGAGAWGEACVRFLALSLLRKAWALAAGWGGAGVARSRRSRPCVPSVVFILLQRRGGCEERRVPLPADACSYEMARVCVVPPSPPTPSCPPGIDSMYSNNNLIVNYLPSALSEAEFKVGGAENVCGWSSRHCGVLPLLCARVCVPCCHTRGRRCDGCVRALFRGCAGFA